MTQVLKVPRKVVYNLQMLGLKSKDLWRLHQYHISNCKNIFQCDTCYSTLYKFEGVFRELILASVNIRSDVEYDG